MENSLVKSSLFLMVGRGIGFIISAIVPIFIVRILSVAEYGEYRQLYLLMSTLSIIIPFGMQQGLFYFLPNNPTEKDYYLGQSINIHLIFGVTLFLFLILFRNGISDFFHNPSFKSYIPIIGMASIALALSLIIENVLIVENNTLLSAKVLVLSRIIRASIIVCLAIYGSIISIFYGLLIFLGIKSIISYIYFKKKYHIALFQFDYSIFKTQIKYALPLALGGILAIIIAEADKYIISYRLGAEQFAIYAVGCYEIPFILIFFQSIGDVVLPKIVSYRRSNNIDKIIKLWHLSIINSFLLGIPIFIFAYVFAKDIVTFLFTEKYIDAVPVFRLSVISILIESTRFGVMTRAFAKTGYSFVVATSSCIIMLVICNWAAREYGMKGAISAVLIGKFLIMAGELIISKYLLKIRWMNFYPVLKIAVISVITMISISAILLLSSFINRYFTITHNTLNLGISLSIYFIIFTSIYSLITNRMGIWKLEDAPIPEKIKNMLSNIAK